MGEANSWTKSGQTVFICTYFRNFNVKWTRQIDVDEASNVCDIVEIPMKYRPIPFLKSILVDSVYFWLELLEQHFYILVGFLPFESRWPPRYCCESFGHLSCIPVERAYFLVSFFNLNLPPACFEKLRHDAKFGPYISKGNSFTSSSYLRYIRFHVMSMFKFPRWSKDIQKMPACISRHLEWSSLRRCS